MSKLCDGLAARVEEVGKEERSGQVKEREEVKVDLIWKEVGCLSGRGGSSAAGIDWGGGTMGGGGGGSTSIFVSGSF